MASANVFSLQVIAALLAAMLAFSSEAQTIFNHNSSITVAPNTSMSVLGEVRNEGTIINHGHLKVSGPWLNSGSYLSGTGEITFNGRLSTVPQIIHHNGQSFNKVSITGGEKKIIISDLRITNSIRFSSGIVEGAGESKIILEPEATIVGASDSSHVHGLVYHSGSGAKLFPIGNGLVYLPVELPDVRDDSAFVGVRAFEMDNAELNKPTALASIYSKRYWYIDFRKGSHGSLSSPIILPVRDTYWPANPEEIIVAQSSAPNADFRSIGGSWIAADGSGGKIRSELDVTMPFVALATTARESALIVYNAVSPNGDGMNDFVRIENIELYPVNRFLLFNRWGDKVFQIDHYDNGDRVFTGRANVGGSSELVSGNYFYILEIPGQESLQGFISLKN